MPKHHVTTFLNYIYLFIDLCSNRFQRHMIVKNILVDLRFQRQGFLVHSRAEDRFRCADCAPRRGIRQTWRVSPFLADDVSESSLSRRFGKRSNKRRASAADSRAEALSSLVGGGPSPFAVAFFRMLGPGPPTFR